MISCANVYFPPKLKARDLLICLCSPSVIKPPKPLFSCNILNEGMPGGSVEYQDGGKLGFNSSFVKLPFLGCKAGLFV